jgi:hypothetical protein
MIIFVDFLGRIVVEGDILTPGGVRHTEKNHRF